MNNHRKGSTAVVVIIIVVILIGVFAYLNYAGILKLGNPSGSVDVPISMPGWEKYSDDMIQFEYPTILTAKRTGDKYQIDHSLAYKHSDVCDFKGDSAPLDRFTDFAVEFSIVDKPVKETILALGEYPGWDYASDNPVKIGKLAGYKIMSAVEMCGTYDYYMILAPTKTLVIRRHIVTELTSSIGNNQQYLNIPGVITSDQEEELFTSMFLTLQIK